MTRRKTDAKFRAEVKALVGDEYLVLDKYQKSNIKIRFKHQKCQSVFKMRPAQFLFGNRCPKCMAYTNTKLTDKQLKSRVKKLGHGEYQPLQKSKGSKQKILMLHKKCGNQYYVRPNDFFNGRRCPVCSRKNGSKNKTISFSKIKQIVNQQTNGEYDILPQNYKNVRCKAIFYHKKCGNFYETYPYIFLLGSRCPFCKSSKGEKSVAQYLQKNNVIFKAQYKIPECKDKRPLPFDFAVFNSNKTLNCLIEYQGEQHFYDPFSYHNQFFSKESVLRTQKHDVMKLKYCKDHGIKLIRINHPQTSNKSNSIEFIERLVNRTLNKELRVS